MALGTKMTCAGATVTWNSVLIGNPVSFSGFAGAVADKPRTTLASSAHEFAPGLPDYGELTVEVYRDVNDDGAAAIVAGYAAGTIANLKLQLPAGTNDVGTVSAYVKSFDIKASGVDSDIMGTVVFRCTGALVWAAT